MVVFFILKPILGSTIASTLIGNSTTWLLHKNNPLKTQSFMYFTVILAELTFISVFHCYVGGNILKTGKNGF